ncbi:MAG: GlsB/YeaQ/YmgE family stress response membrane protein [Myxococcales bacterium]|nr:GlsB/YeaQ/YmgE family stress response membrane protein [Myxococcales bacterium]
MHLLLMFVVGVIVGTAARLASPSLTTSGTVTVISLSVAGAVVGGYIGQTFGTYGLPPQAAAVLASLFGAALVVTAYATFPQRGRFMRRV